MDGPSSRPLAIAATRADSARVRDARPRVQARTRARTTCDARGIGRSTTMRRSVLPHEIDATQARRAASICDGHHA
ncbi:hypothetical protein WI23_30310 [Burkholderia oklahomensis C6786]|nr:hypothetical protein WI23_30310 [Burkholderia oklahomensis C6786]KUY53094.1 hypothetical protein WI23_23140 [Burkholderia oklahomensis C6786]